MTEQEKINWLINPGKFFPMQLKRGELLGNHDFINAASTYLGILAESQYWDRSLIERIQAERLRLFTSVVADRSPFWKAFFDQHGFKPQKAELADIKRLPILKRDFLIDPNNKIHIDTQPSDEPIFKRTSSGTTGVPLKLIYNEREMIIGYITVYRHPVFENINLKDLFFRKHFIVLGKPGFRYVFETDFFYKAFPDIQIEDLDDLNVRKEIYTAIREAGPAILVGFGSLIAKLARHAEKDGVELPLMAIRISSESVATMEIDIIKRVFKAPIINMLSGNGTGVIGFECPKNEGKFHVNSENIILEVVDGALTATSLPFTLTPIIRFDHNDEGKLSDDNCKCERTLPLFEFNGRRGHCIVMPSGKKISMIHLHNVVMEWWGGSLKVKQVQVIQDKPDGIRIMLVPQKNFNEGDEIELRLAVTKLFAGEKMLIEIEHVNKIMPSRGHKPRFFIPLSEASELKKADP